MLQSYGGLSFSLAKGYHPPPLVVSVGILYLFYSGQEQIFSIFAPVARWASKNNMLNSPATNFAHEIIQDFYSLIDYWPLLL
jgi:hypothetical protein